MDTRALSSNNETIGIESGEQGMPAKGGYVCYLNPVRSNDYLVDGLYVDNSDLHSE